MAKALQSLPKDLKATYDRLLDQIPETESQTARVMLQWLVFSFRPLEFSELATAAMIDFESGTVDRSATFDSEDIRRLLAGLITDDQSSCGHDESVPDIDQSAKERGPRIEYRDGCDSDETGFGATSSSEGWETQSDDEYGAIIKNESSTAQPAPSSIRGGRTEEYDSDGTGFGAASPSGRWKTNSDDKCGTVIKRASSTVQLAHSSVREYLMAIHPCPSQTWACFGNAENHGFLADCSLIYLGAYSDLSDQGSENTRHECYAAWPLLAYSAEYWYEHTALRKDGLWDRAFSILGSDKRTKDLAPFGLFAWIFWQSRDLLLDMPQSGLYYACFLGYFEVVQAIINRDGLAMKDVPPRKAVKTLLAVTSFQRHLKILRLLLDQIANFKDSQNYVNETLIEALGRSTVDAEVVDLLVSRGATVSFQSEFGDSALRRAIDSDNFDAARVLLDRGAQICDVHKYDCEHSFQPESAFIRVVNRFDKRTVKLCLGYDLPDMETLDSLYNGSLLMAVCSSMVHHPLDESFLQSSTLR